MLGPLAGNRMWERILEEGGQWGSLQIDGSIGEVISTVWLILFKAKRRRYRGTFPVAAMKSTWYDWVCSMQLRVSSN